jgi:serine/threonine protein kinase
MNEFTTESPYELHKDLKFIKEIDQGAFGKVIHAYETKKNLDLAVKVINKGGLNANLIEEMKEEISILKKLNHDNIVKFYGYSETNNQLLIKMEYIKYGTLSKWMKGKQKIKEEEASVILSKVLSAVEYMHSMHICHRDLKPENIMFSEENDLSSIKIIDFGLSAQHFNYLTNNEYCGTLIYMAPEQIEKKLYHYSVDIWSIGILMFMLLNGGKHPFYQKNDKKEDVIKKIKIGKLNFINKLSFMAKNLNQKLCEVNPSWRYSANLAIKHPWITRNPNDEIPLTFNEILNRNNSKKNWNHLIMTCIFLNYYKKKEIKAREKGKESKLYINNFIKKKRNKLYYITKKYVNKCNIISEKEKEKYLKRRERCLEVESTEEEDSIEKEQVTIANKNKRNSIKKDTNKFNSMERNYKEDLYLNNNLLSPNLNINKTKKKFTINSKPTKLNDNTIFNNNKKCIGTSKSIYIFSTPNDENDNNKYKHQNSGEIKLNNKINQNNINSNNLNSNTNRASCKSISKFNINTIVKKEQLPKDIKRVSLIQKTPKYNYNLPNVSKSGKINNIHVNINTTSKKQYSNNNVRNYNIIPLVLPFIKI